MFFIQLFKIKDPEKIPLDSGRTLQEIEVAYHTFGELNTSKDNVILICHPLTGSSNAMEWWPKIEGPGLPIDTNQYFVVCTNALGGCSGTTGPTSINPTTNMPYLLDFPVITVADMVRVQRELITHLEVKKINQTC